MLVATYYGDPDFEVEDRVELFDASAYHLTEIGNWRSYDVASDDQRFVMMKAVDVSDQPGGPRHILVQNFFEELKRLVPN